MYSYYIVIIFFSGLFSYFAQQSKGILQLYVCSLFAVLIPAFMSGVRDLDVGFDVMFYEYGVFKNASQASSLQHLFHLESDLDPGFVFINFIASRISDNIHFALGLISFLTVGYAYLACIRCRKSCSLSLMYTMFLLYYYASSQNWIRQSLATGICFYAFTILKDKGLGLKYLLVSIFAISCHITAIIPCSIFVIFLYAKRLSKRQLKILLSIVIVGCAIAYFIFVRLLDFFGSITNEKDYTGYADNTQLESWARAHISLSQLLLFIICLVTSYYFRKKYKDLSPYVTFSLATSSVFCIFAVLLGSYTATASRIILYFVFVLIYFLSYIINISQLNSLHRKIYHFMVLIYFVYLHFKLSYSSLDYSSTILGIN